VLASLIVADWNSEYFLCLTCWGAWACVVNSSASKSDASIYRLIPWVSRAAPQRGRSPDGAREAKERETVAGPDPEGGPGGSATKFDDDWGVLQAGGSAGMSKDCLRFAIPAGADVPFFDLFMLVCMSLYVK